MNTRDLPIVLIVEDDPLARTFYTEALRASGFAVEAAADGATAVARVATRRPSVVVADLGLPDFDGFEVCRQLKLRRESRDVPVIALTGRAMALRDIEYAEQAGFQSVLIKPCAPETLAAAIRRVLPAAATGPRDP